MRGQGQLATGALLVVLLGGSAVSRYLSLLDATGVDFYQFWGLPTAMKLSHYRLGNPYRETRRYTAVLAEYVQTSEDPRLGRVYHWRKQLNLTGTPFLFVTFSVLPRNYSSALTMFRWTTLFLLLAALAVLGALYGNGALFLSCLAPALLLSFKPLHHDLLFGNISSLQLFCLAAVLALARRLRAEREATLTGGLLLTVLMLLTLLKPNLPFVTMLVPVYVWDRLRSGAFLRALLLPAALLPAFLLLPCWYFGSSTVWADWYWAALQGVVYSPPRLEAGNSSITVFLARLGIARGTSVVIVGALLAISLGAVIWRSAKTRGSGRGAWRAIVGGIVADCDLLMALGLTAVFALSPLAWVHNHMLLLIPGLWLMGSGQSREALLGAASLVLCSGVLEIAFPGQVVRSNFLVGLSWLPLWAAIALRIAAPSPTPLEAETLRVIRATNQALRAR